MSIDPISTLSSGLYAFGVAAATTANNIVNAGTPGYQRNDGVFQAQAGGGVSFQPTAPSGSVDLASEIVTLNSLAIGYTATAHAISSTDRTQSAVLDLLA